jgi:hypothetical protein
VTTLPKTSSTLLLSPLKLARDCRQRRRDEE